MEPPATGPTLSGRVTALVREAAGLPPEEPLADSTPLVGTGLALDSVNALQLILALEAEFNIEIGADELGDDQALATLGTLVRFVSKKTGAKG